MAYVAGLDWWQFCFIFYPHFSPWQLERQYWRLDIWDTDYNSDNWEPGVMVILVTWQLIVTLNSIRNSCDVFVLFSFEFLFLSTVFCVFLFLVLSKLCVCQSETMWIRIQNHNVFPKTQHSPGWFVERKPQKIRKQKWLKLPPRLMIATNQITWRTLTATKQTKIMQWMINLRITQQRFFIIWIIYWINIQSEDNSTMVLSNFQFNGQSFVIGQILSNPQSKLKEWRLTLPVHLLVSWKVLGKAHF